MDSASPAQFAVALTTSTFLFPLAFFVAWRLASANRDYPLTTKELRTGYAIIACVAALSSVECIKAVMFGVYFFDISTATVFTVFGEFGLFIALQIVAEVAHLLTYVAVLWRLNDLIVPPKQLNDGAGNEINQLAAYILIVVRICVPAGMIGNAHI